MQNLSENGCEVEKGEGEETPHPRVVGARHWAAPWVVMVASVPSSSGPAHRSVHSSASGRPGTPPVIHLEGGRRERISRRPHESVSKLPQVEVAGKSR